MTDKDDTDILLGLLAKGLLMPHEIDDWHARRASRKDGQIDFKEIFRVTIKECKYIINKKYSKAIMRGMIKRGIYVIVEDLTYEGEKSFEEQLDEFMYGYLPG